MWYWHDGAGGWGVLWMGLMMAVVWLPLIVILVWALRQFGQPFRREEPPPGRAAPEPDAVELARRAYARGELVRERYLEIINDLEQTKARSDGT